MASVSRRQGESGYTRQPPSELSDGVALYVFLLFMLVAGSFGALFVWAVTKVEESESWRLIKAFLKAKKERVCPTLQFTDD